MELESARSQDRRKVVQLEQQFKDQLLDRNNLLLALWNRLSTLCGADWAQKNSLVNGELPSLDVIARNLAGFNKNIILAVKKIESIVGGFRSRVRSIEKDLWRDYQTLEHTLDVRVKRLDQLERLIVSSAKAGPHAHRGTPSRSSSSAEIHLAEVTRLRSENKSLKAQLQFEQRHQAAQDDNMLQVPGASPNRNSVAATLLRHHSTSAVEILQKQQEEPKTTNSTTVQRDYTSAPLQPSEQRWIHRLKELEKRLKAEREARLLDRSGARKMLQEGKAENEELRAMLERERERNGSTRGLGIEGAHES